MISNGPWSFDTINKWNGRIKGRSYSEIIYSEILVVKIKNAQAIHKEQSQKLIIRAPLIPCDD